MLCIRNIFLFTVSTLYTASVISSLQESFADSGILITEEAIRNTTNKLFSILKLKRDNPRLSQYIITNKHFASITLQDNDNLNEIAKLSRVTTKTNNGSTDFMTVINNLLNDDNLNIQENEIKPKVLTEDHDHVVEIIKTFLKRLRQARELHDVDKYAKINENILNVIKGAQIANMTNENDQDDQYMNINTTSEDIEFWKPSGRRIYGGERTKIKYFPFIASIQMFNNFQCAGSIIKSDLIITASSCLQLAWNNRFFRENPAFLSVRVGSSFYSGGGEVIPVLEVYFHPTYDPKTLRNNICIVRLTKKIKFSWRVRKRVRKIDIDRHPNKLPFNTPGITILGWGAKGRSNIVRDLWSNVLSFAVLDIYPLIECQEVYSKEYVTKTNFCAGFMSRGGGACNRDIGDPGIDEGTLVGVVSFGSPVCGAADAPTVFTKLGYYADWIDGIMEQEVPFSRKRTTLKPSKPRMANRPPPSPSTKFKIPAMSGGPIKPIPVNEIENVLRMFDDDMFNEFMKTMFNSNEMAEYKDVFKEVKEDMINKILDDGKLNVKKENQVLKDEKKILQDGKHSNTNVLHKITSPYVEPDAEESTTKLVEFEEESVETATEYDRSNKNTVLDNITDLKTETVGYNIQELMENINLNKIIEEEAAVNKKDVKGDTKSIVFDELESTLSGGNKNESVLTLLYLSEENKDRNKEVNESTEGSKGLSIAADSFQDLTRSKDTNNFNGLPESELYELLSEVIGDEVRNNEIKL